ncbi:MAG TPA: glutamine ABC transporter substrate-binding protein [Oribacterium sp.]|nr:glutamine ABC transporter substrate-binding protein [Oribacterium sp.]
MKKSALVMAVTMAVLGLSACGGSDASTPAATTAAGTTAAATTAAAADTTAAAEETTAAAGDSDKVWQIVTDTAFKPFEYTDDSGKLVGIDVDILAAIADDQGFKYEIKSIGWDASIAACQAGQADGMIAGASITDERKSSGWIFSDGYYDANQSMAVAENSDITGFDDLKGKSVAVKTASMSADYAESLKDQYGFDITYFEDSPTMYQAVVGGQVAACFDDTPIMASNIKDTGLGMKILDGTGNDPAEYGFAIFDSSKQELIDMFNAGLKDIKANGKYDEIIANYLG